jgi:hypothetical protein
MGIKEKELKTPLVQHTKASWHIITASLILG